MRLKVKYAPKVQYLRVGMALQAKRWRELQVKRWGEAGGASLLGSRLSHGVSWRSLSQSMEVAIIEGMERAVRRVGRRSRGEVRATYAIKADTQRVSGLYYEPRDD